MSQSERRRIASIFAFTGVLLWIGILVGLTVVNGSSYDSLTQPGSELSLRRYGWLMDIGFFVLGIGVASLGYAFSTVLQGSKWIPRLLGIVGLLLFLSGIFHTEMGSGTQPSLHNTLGLLAFIVSIAAMFTASRTFRTVPQWQSMARPTLIWAIAALGTFFLVPMLGETALGLAQRIFAATLFTWFLASAIRIYKMSPQVPATPDIPVNSN